MSKTMWRIVTIGAAVAASSLLGQVAPARAICVGTSVCVATSQDPVARERESLSNLSRHVEQRSDGAIGAAGDACQGLGGGKIGPIPAPTPGVRPGTDGAALPSVGSECESL